ncbi:MAG: strawberry notch family protein, partial [Acidobacteriota bacterium]|nr:strawberry notch family protein [Acidobacteriota bacterium]
MIEQSQTEFTKTAVANANKFTSDFASAPADGISVVETYGGVPSVSSGDLMPAQSAGIGKANVHTEENLYRCHHLTGGAKHPGTIVETPGLANIKPPRPSYRPRLPKE